MMKLHVHAHLLLAIVTELCFGEWNPSDCPGSCVCHVMWNENLETILNTLDCKDRDMITLDVVPKNTEALALSGNKIRVETIKRQNLSDIRYVDLSANQLKIHQVESLQTLFAQLQSMRALDLSENYLESLQAGLFNELNLLEVLSLSGNSIAHLERNTFQPLTNLKTLNLNENHLRAINENWFGNTSMSLLDLNMKSNQIARLEGGDLIHVTQLERLILSQNNLTFIHPEVFANSDIQELHLDGNLLTEIPNKAMVLLSNLAILRLDNNPITALHHHSAANLSKVKRISLSNMPYLRIVYASAFINLPELIMVDLGQNPMLEYVHPRGFANCTALEILHLHTGALRGLDERILESLPALKELSLYNNNIHCNCIVSWLKNTTFTNIDGDKIVCESPHAFREATLYQLDEAQLNADCEPLVILMSRSEIVANFGTDVDIECQALGSTNLQWIMPHRRESNIQNNESTTPSDGKLHLPMVQHNDDGVYVCLAESDSGELDSASVNVRVVHSDIRLTTLAISKSFIVLQWDDTVGSSVISFTASNEVIEEVEIPAGVKQYTLEGLTPNSDHTICLLYHNRLETACLTVHMLPKRRTDISSSSTTSQTISAVHTTTQSILIVFAIIGILVVMGIILAVIYRKCQRHKNTKLLYLRQKNESGVTEDNIHIKLEQCYNSTTAPLCENELV